MACSSWKRRSAKDCHGQSGNAAHRLPAVLTTYRGALCSRLAADAPTSGFLCRSRLQSRPPQGARSIYLIALALHPLAQELAIASDCLGFFPRPPFRRLLVIAPQLHFSKYALALHFLLQGSQSLIDIIIANEDLHGGVSPSMVCVWG